MSLHSLRATSDRPLYRQLVDCLRVDLAAKAPGDRIDSEPQLAKRFGVSRFTVTRAIEILVDEGLINRRQGLGSFVAAPPLKRTPSYLLSFTEAVQSQGRFASHRLLNFGPVLWREGLPYPAGSPLIALDRLRLVDRIPTALHRSIISAEVASAIGLDAEIARAPRYRAELRRDLAATINTIHRQNVKVKEQGNATNSNTQHAFGPRLGPWGDHRSGG